MHRNVEDLILYGIESHILASLNKNKGHQLVMPRRYRKQNLTIILKSRGHFISNILLIDILI